MSPAGHYPRAFLALALLVTACANRAGEAVDQTTPIVESAASATTTPTTTTTIPTTTTTTEAPDTDPPPIATDPPTGSVSRSYVTAVTILTEPGASLLVDGAPFAVDHNGVATVHRRSAIGANSIVIEATDTASNVATETVTYDFEPEPGWIVLVGDSVTLGSKVDIEQRLGAGVVDATVSRQFADAIGPIGRLASSESPPSVVVIALGTNGPVNDRLFDRMMEKLSDTPLVVFVNTRVPRKWEGGTNAALAAGVERYQNAVLVDWWGSVDDQPQLFGKDGFHPRPAGRTILAELIAEAIFPEPNADATAYLPGSAVTYTPETPTGDLGREAPADAD